LAAKHGSMKRRVSAKELSRLIEEHEDRELDKLGYAHYRELKELMK
jgi:hypothetical protein